MSGNTVRRKKIDVIGIPVGRFDLHDKFPNTKQFYYQQCVSDGNFFIGPRKQRYCRLCYEESILYIKQTKNIEYVKKQFMEGRGKDEPEFVDPDYEDL